MTSMNRSRGRSTVTSVKPSAKVPGAHSSAPDRVVSSSFRYFPPR